MMEWRDSKRFMVGAGMVPDLQFQCVTCMEWFSFGCGGGEMVPSDEDECEHCVYSSSEWADE